MKEYPEAENSLEERLFSDLIDAQKEVDDTLKELEELFRSTVDQRQAEQVALMSFAPRLEQAQAKAGEALKKWLEFVRSEIKN